MQNCNFKIVLHNLSSLIGPNHTNVKFINVILEVLIISLFSSNSRSIKWRQYSNFKIGLKMLFGGSSFKFALDGYIKPSFSLNLGNLCLGQGTNLNS